MATLTHDKDDSVPKGDCFEAAAAFVTQEEILTYPDDYKLVHGNVATLRQDEPVNHAWVEEGETVHEVSNGRTNVFWKDDFYARFGITTVRKYTPKQALLLMVRTGHSGPWDEPNDSK